MVNTDIKGLINEGFDLTHVQHFIVVMIILLQMILIFVLTRDVKIMLEFLS